MKLSNRNYTIVELLGASKKYLDDSLRYFRNSDYERSFSNLRRSVNCSCHILGTATEIPGLDSWRTGHEIAQTVFNDRALNLYDLDDKYAALEQILSFVEGNDEKLDILIGFLADSDIQTILGRHLPEGAHPTVADQINDYGVCAYRQMIMSLVADLPNRRITSAGAEDYAQMIDFRFALAAYLETLIDHQRMSLEFMEANFLSASYVARRVAGGYLNTASGHSFIMNCTSFPERRYSEHAGNAPDFS